MTGHREYNPGWHTAIDLRNLLTVSEAITRSAIERKESRGGHFREDFPDKRPEFATFNIVTARAAEGTDGGTSCPDPGNTARTEADHRGRTEMSSATFRIWRSDGATGGGFRDYPVTWCRDGGARRRASNPGDAGTRSGRTLELQGRQMRIVFRRDQRPPEADVHDAAQLAADRSSRSPSSRCARSR